MKGCVVDLGVNAPKEMEVLPLISMEAREQRERWPIIGTLVDDDVEANFHTTHLGGDREPKTMPAWVARKMIKRSGGHPFSFRDVSNRVLAI